MCHQWQLGHLNQVLDFGSCSWQICRRAAWALSQLVSLTGMYQPKVVTLFENRSMNPKTKTSQICAARFHHQGQQMQTIFFQKQMLLLEYSNNILNGRKFLKLYDIFRIKFKCSSLVFNNLMTFAYRTNKWNFALTFRKHLGGHLLKFFFDPSHFIFEMEKITNLAGFLWGLNEMLNVRQLSRPMQLALSKVSALLWPCSFHLISLWATSYPK